MELENAGIMWGLILTWAIGGFSFVCGQHDQLYQTSLPNILFILTDDQDEVLGGMVSNKDVMCLLVVKCGFTFVGSCS